MGEAVQAVPSAIPFMPVIQVEVVEHGADQQHLKIGIK